MCTTLGILTQLNYTTVAGRQASVTSKIIDNCDDAAITRAEKNTELYLVRDDLVSIHSSLLDVDSDPSVAVWKREIVRR